MAHPRSTSRAAPTLESVAALAGVSRATAGRVLAGSTTVGEAAREAVLRAADELSYVTNRAARALMTRRSGSIAFVVAESEERFFADPHFALVLRGVHAGVADQDVQLVFSIVHDAAEQARFERFARAGHLDGVILTSLHGDHPLPRALAAAGLPVMMLGRPLVPVEGTGHVDADNVHGGRLAAARLADGGRTRLATLAGPHDMTAALDREEGFRAELAERGLPPPATVEGDFSMGSGQRAMAALLAAHPTVDGVFAANDLMALGAYQALADAGRRVPDDVAVVGFDDVPSAASARPGLTTVRQPTFDMGARLATRLLETIKAGEVPEPVLVPTELVVRESA
jgi:DNA-binding LacI/PurR family transcriptional regulator